MIARCNPCSLNVWQKMMTLSTNALDLFGGAAASVIRDAPASRERLIARWLSKPNHRSMAAWFNQRRVGGRERRWKRGARSQPLS